MYSTENIANNKDYIYTGAQGYKMQFTKMLLTMTTYYML